MRRWDRFRDPWDREYAKRGRLWRGRASPEPLSSFVSPPGTVVEIGCGDGKFVGALVEAGFHVVAVDRSVHALRLLGAWPGVVRVRADARRLPFPDGSASTVVARYLLSALLGPARLQASQELMRVTRPGGILFLEDFSTSDFRFGQGEEVEPRTFARNQGIFAHYFEAGELRGAFPTWTILLEEQAKSALRIRGTSHPRVADRLVLRAPG